MAARIVSLAVGWLGVSVVSVAIAASEPDEAGVFDPPLSRVSLPLTDPPPDRGAELTCYRYQGFSLKVVESASTSGDVSIAVAPDPAPGTAAPCERAAAPGESSMPGPGFDATGQENDQAGYAFAGIKGRFLVMNLVDAQGASKFRVYDLTTLRLRFADGTDMNGPAFIADEAGTLRLHYRRGINAACSVPEQGQACWDQLARDWGFPPDIAATAAPVADCEGAYRAESAPRDDPSIVYYEVEMVVPPDETARVAATGKVTCEPMP